jgi:lincosamide nucleotidyltransferase
MLTGEYRMPLQDQMIARMRAICAEDDRLNAAMMYGSFTYGEGDAFSDIEFLLFFEDDAFAEIDPRAWLAQIAPVDFLYVNEHGITVVIFENLIRGEFHFHRVVEMTIAQAWPGVIAFPTLEATLIVDKSGQLTPFLEPIIGPPPDRLTPPGLQFVVDGFINWCWFGFNVLRRGEHARALEILTITHRHLLHMARALARQTDHWLTPSRLAERDLPPEMYERFRACTAALDAADLRRAYVNAWTWGREMMAELGKPFGLSVPAPLCARITAAITSEAAT